MVFFFFYLNVFGICFLTCGLLDFFFWPKLWIDMGIEKHEKEISCYDFFLYAWYNIASCRRMEHEIFASFCFGFFVCGPCICYNVYVRIFKLYSRIVIRNLSIFIVFVSILTCQFNCNFFEIFLEGQNKKFEC